MPPARVEGDVERRIIGADGLEHIVGTSFQPLGMDSEWNSSRGLPKRQHLPRTGADGFRLQQGARNVSGSRSGITNSERARRGLEFVEVAADRGLERIVRRAHPRGA